MSGVDTAIAAGVGLKRDSAVDACRNNMDFFGAICLPEVFLFLFPPIFKAIWQLLVTAVSKATGQEKIAIGLPRGFAKTLVLKLFVVYCILFTDRKFILVVCNTATLAENFIADVVDTLDSLNIKMLFGDWRLGMEKDTQDTKKFTFKGRAISLVGLGSNSSLRGLNLKYVRPDVMLMDDMQSKEESDSITDSNNQLNWLLGTLMKANNKRRCLFIFLGNMYSSEGCILKKLKKSSSWISFVTGCILEDGESLWPELRSVEDLLAELEHDDSMGHPEIFYAEMMNDEEAGSRSTIDFSKINMWTDEYADLTPEGGWVIIDPALAKKTSDECAIGCFLLYNGEPVLKEVESGQFTEQEKVANCIKMALRNKVPCIIVEAVAYQESLCHWISHYINQLQIRALKVLTVTSGGIDKNSRIMAAARSLTEPKKDRLWIHKNVRSIVTHQFIYWNPLKKKNKDDILDLLGYAWKIIHQYGMALLNPFELPDDIATSSFSDTLQLEF